MVEFTAFAGHPWNEPRGQSYEDTVVEIGWLLLSCIVGLAVVRTAYDEWKLRCQTTELIYYVLCLFMAMTTIPSWRNELASEIYRGAVNIHSSMMKKIIVLWLFYLTISIVLGTIFTKLDLVKTLPNTASSSGVGQAATSPSLLPLLLGVIVMMFKLVSHLQRTIERAE